MPISDVASLVGGAALGAPFSEIVKLVIAEAKKVKDFKPLFKDLTSTMERLVPILQEIDSLQESLDPVNGELNLLIKTMQRAEELARKCSRVRWYSLADKTLYTREIKRINEGFLRFCQVDLQLIQLRNQLRSKLSLTSLNIEEESPPHRLEEGNSYISTRASLDEDEQQIIWESLKEKGNGRQVKEDEQLAAVVQESLIIEESRRLEENSNISTRASSLDEDEQRIIWESLKEKGNGRQVKKFKFKQVAAVVQESLILEESCRLEENSNISTRASLDKDEQLEKVIWESLKEKSKEKQTKNEKLSEVINLPRSSVRGGCNSETKHGRSLVCVFVCVLGITAFWLCYYWDL